MSKDIVASSNMHAYFSRLQKDTDACYSIANKARKRGLDPELEVEIPQALDIASRVEQLVGPEGIASKIRKTTKEIGNRELVSLEIARQIVGGKTYKFNKAEDALDQAVRTGLAILTEGVLVAPLEGIAEVKLGSNKDGTNYVDLYFSGPIRSAGGTGQAMSVLIADVVRREVGIGKYKPTSGEIERYKEEIPLYRRAQHLQYTPSVDEIHTITKACPVCINGEGTEDVEVTGYRDLPRVGTNRLRGGACLVIAEGLCLKAPKLLKHVKKLKLKGWDFLDIFVNKGNGEDKENTEEIPAILPSTKYIGEVIAGRPVFSHPSRKGGFRLRYGRARTAGLASTAISPASMNILDGFIAVGTQLKTERPGKGTIGTPCSQLEGPIILLQNGDLVQVNDAKSVKKYNVKKIIDIGEILIPFGEFIENNALLPNSPYVYEWWVQDLQKSINCLPKHYNPSGIAESDEKAQRKINEGFDRKINLRQPSFLDAVKISTKYSIPLHPYYNLFWHDITADDVTLLAKYVRKYGEIASDMSLVIPWDGKIKNTLIELGALHKKRQEKIILDRYAYPLVRCLGLDIKDRGIIETNRFDLLETAKEGESTVSFVSRLTGLNIRERAPFRIGTRMGRPEKADVRKMKPPPHVLFPLGTYGSNQRLFSKAAQKGEIEVEAGKRRCSKCGKVTYKISCTCGGHTEPIEGRIEVHKINLSEELKLAKNNIKMRNLPEIIKGVQGTISKHKTPEPLEKGLLRAKHKLPVFKDGTTRFDMTDAPLTHFKPKE
ncbi:MAG: DNA polymerase II large subunit, partial [Candidatus Thermoplasmatota archaeon]|nr:DNA polymerase II large subunit [Candidatus Thermoplasmatota archaeon]